MERSKYFDLIEEKINLLATRINSRGRLNVLNLNLHCEIFYAQLVNILYNWNLSNANHQHQNIEAIDLIDYDQKIIVQVSATSTREKIESSLSKPLISKNPNFTFKFISIANDADNLKKITYKNPNNCRFNPKEDIIDKNKILSTIFNMKIEKQKPIYDFILKELGSPDNALKLESSITDLINVLSAEDFSESNLITNYDPFEIEEKIDFNSLNSTKEIIQDCSLYAHKVEKKYEIFDKEGVNKSISVLRAIHTIYVKAQNGTNDPDTIFLNTVDEIVNVAKNSSNFAQMSIELLQMTAEIIAVDAFMRCKIFKNPPKREKYASS